ncbi:putative RNA polymerase sigma factor FecI [Nitrospira sp. KM1]|uniref:RNA polymerase sigma factor n=1 Tax=Nitrospira sp. KM1 TaxID=1936990 RepID=UPI0013A73CD6|nr:RNA polymerase sigma factor [Nitrospira sp. KM1]BCA53923.1 putative RNA polymerase sigma factor FecI [Nitrospira sp. KM1]
MNLTYSDIERLFDEQRHVLTLHVTRLVRSKELATDLVQEAFTRILGIAGKENVIYPRSLLYRTAINLAIDHLRSRKTPTCSLSEPVTEDAALNVASLIPTPDRELSAKQQLQQVQAVIDQLPPRCRHAFLLHRVEGYSYVQIARELGISKSAVEKLITRALKQCWNSLDLLDFP